MAVAFTVYLLTQNKNVEAELLREIDALGRDVEPTLSNLENWKYSKVTTAASVFKIKQIVFLDTLIQKRLKIHSFRGDLTDIPSV